MSLPLLFGVAALYGSAAIADAQRTRRSPAHVLIRWARGIGVADDLTTEQGRRRAVEDALGRPYGAEDLLAIAGVGGLPDTGRMGDPVTYDVRIIVSAAYISVELRGGWLDAMMLREIWRSEDGEGIVCENNGLFLYDDAPPGIGRAILAAQAEAGRRLGVRELRTEAERSKITVGYYVWARLGFDGETPRTTLDALALARRKKTLPKELRRGRFQNVQDFMRTEVGRTFWREHGDTFLGFYRL